MSQQEMINFVKKKISKKQNQEQQRSHSSFTASAALQWGIRRAHLLTLQRWPRPDNGDNILPLTMVSQSALWAKAQRWWVALGFPPLSEATQPCGEMALLVCLKAQAVSSAEGLAFHSLHIVLQATMGSMGARPFVISSVVNFCWGNKGVTHLWLWIRAFFFFLPSFFSSLVFCFSFLRHCPWQFWPHQKSSLRRRWSTPPTVK